MEEKEKQTKALSEEQIENFKTTMRSALRIDLKLPGGRLPKEYYDIDLEPFIESYIETRPEAASYSKKEIKDLLKDPSFVEHASGFIKEEREKLLISLAKNGDQEELSFIVGPEKATEMLKKAYVSQILSAKTKEERKAIESKFAPLGITSEAMSDFYAQQEKEITAAVEQENLEGLSQIVGEKTARAMLIERAMQRGDKKAVKALTTGEYTQPIAQPIVKAKMGQKGLFLAESESFLARMGNGIVSIFQGIGTFFSNLRNKAKRKEEEKKKAKIDEALKRGDQVGLARLVGEDKAREMIEERAQQVAKAQASLDKGTLESLVGPERATEMFKEAYKTEMATAKGKASKQAIMDKYAKGLGDDFVTEVEKERNIEQAVISGSQTKLAKLVGPERAQQMLEERAQQIDNAIKTLGKETLTALVGSEKKALTMLRSAYIQELNAAAPGQDQLAVTEKYQALFGEGFLIQAAKEDNEKRDKIKQAVKDFNQKSLVALVGPEEARKLFKDAYRAEMTAAAKRHAHKKQAQISKKYSSTLGEDFIAEVQNDAIAQVDRPTLEALVGPERAMEMFKESYRAEMAAAKDDPEKQQAVKDEYSKTFGEDFTAEIETEALQRGDRDTLEILVGPEVARERFKDAYRAEMAEAKDATAEEQNAITTKYSIEFGADFINEVVAEDFEKAKEEALQRGDREALESLVGPEVARERFKEAYRAEMAEAKDATVEEQDAITSKYAAMYNIDFISEIVNEDIERERAARESIVKESDENIRPVIKKSILTRLKESKIGQFFSKIGEAIAKRHTEKKNKIIQTEDKPVDENAWLKEGILRDYSNDKVMQDTIIEVAKNKDRESLESMLGEDEALNILREVYIHEMEEAKDNPEKQQAIIASFEGVLSAEEREGNNLNTVVNLSSGDEGAAFEENGLAIKNQGSDKEIELTPGDKIAQAPEEAAENKTKRGLNPDEIITPEVPKESVDPLAGIPEEGEVVSDSSDEEIELTPGGEVEEVTDEGIGLTTDDIITLEDTGEERPNPAPTEKTEEEPPAEEVPLDENVGLTPGGEVDDSSPKKSWFERWKERIAERKAKKEAKKNNVAVPDPANPEQNKENIDLVPVNPEQNKENIDPIPVNPGQTVPNKESTTTTQAEKQKPENANPDPTQTEQLPEEAEPEDENKKKKPAEKESSGGGAGAPAPSGGGGGRGFGFLKFLGILGMVLGFGLMIAATLLSAGSFGAIAAPIAGLMMAVGSGSYFLSYGLSSDKQTLYKAADKVLTESEGKEKKSKEASTEAENEANAEATLDSEVTLEDEITNNDEAVKDKTVEELVEEASRDAGIPTDIPPEETIEDFPYDELDKDDPDKNNSGNALPPEIVEASAIVDQNATRQELASGEDLTFNGNDLLAETNPQYEEPIIATATIDGKEIEGVVSGDPVPMGEYKEEDPILASGEVPALNSGEAVDENGLTPEQKAKAVTAVAIAGAAYLANNQSDIQMGN